MNHKRDEYQRGLASMMHKFFYKKTESRANVNEVLADELNKPVIKRFKRRKVYTRFKDNIRAADLSEMALLSSFNRGVQYLLCMTDVFTKYTWVAPLMHKKAKTILHGFAEILSKSKTKANRLWVDRRREFYNKFMQN